MDAQTCLLCGYNNATDAKFCQNCGSRFDAGAGIIIEESQPRTRIAVASSPPFPPPPPPPLTYRSSISSAPRQLLSDGVIRGRVRGFQTYSRQTYQGNKIIWAFVVEVHDEAGNLIDTISVQMEANSFTGAVGDGDEVEVRAKRKPNKVLQVDELYNISRRTQVKAESLLPKSLGRVLNVIVAVVGGIMFLAVFALVLFAIFSHPPWESHPLPSVQAPQAPQSIGQFPPSLGLPEVPPTAEETEIELPDCVITFNRGTVELRNEPSLGAPILESIHGGVEYRAIKKRLGSMFTFYQIGTPSNVGWIEGGSMFIQVSSGC